jgi:hypothetical protein
MFKTQGPISVHITEAIHVYEAECRLKYMKKFGNVFLWPEKSDMSQELPENIISKLESPQLPHAVKVSLLPVLTISTFSNSEFCPFTQASQ